MIKRGLTSQKLHLHGETIVAKKDDRLTQLVRSSQNVIFATQTKRPFDPLPDTLTICPNRITITYAGIFGSSEYPLPIENVTEARINTGLVFATLFIETFGLEKPKPLRYLPKEEARLARRYILALVECNRNKVDLSGYNLNELRKYLKQIGKVRHSLLT